jgi:hypothetical protein
VQDTAVGDGAAVQNASSSRRRWADYADDDSDGGDDGWPHDLNHDDDHEAEWRLVVRGRSKRKPHPEEDGLATQGASPADEAERHKPRPHRTGHRPARPDPTRGHIKLDKGKGKGARTPVKGGKTADGKRGKAAAPSLTMGRDKVKPTGGGKDRSPRAADTIPYSAAIASEDGSQARAADSDAISYNGAIAEHCQGPAAAGGDSQFPSHSARAREGSHETSMRASDTTSYSSASRRPEDAIIYTGAISVASRRAEVQQFRERVIRMRVELGALRVGPGSDQAALAIARSFEADMQSLVRARRRREPGPPLSDGADS